LYEATTSFLFLHLHVKTVELNGMGETALCQRPARARLQWAGAWAKPFTSDAEDAAEEPTTWLRNVVQPAVMENHRALDVTLGRTRN